MGRLGTFIGASMASEWTLVAQDLVYDSLYGEVVEWGIQFHAAPCFPTYQWENLSYSVAGGEQLPMRYAAMSLMHGDALFLFGGRDQHDALLSDLYRLDVTRLVWTKLTPVRFDLEAFNPSSAVGASFALTAWGLIRFGGYYRLAQSKGSGNYETSVFVQDPVTLRWSGLEGLLQPWPSPDGSFGAVSPLGRYLSGVAFLSSSSFSSSSSLGDSVPVESLFNQPLDSTRVNYQGALADSLLVVGGFDGATGSISDGSSGGLLGDIWMLRFANWSSPAAR